MPKNQANFANLHFNSFLNKIFSEKEDETDPDGSFFNEVNARNFECH